MAVRAPGIAPSCIEVWSLLIHTMDDVDTVSVKQRRGLRSTMMILDDQWTCGVYCTLVLYSVLVKPRNTLLSCGMILR